MIFKAVKTTLLVGIAVLILGGLIFGSDLVSYVSTSASSVRNAIKESVPIEMELRRARNELQKIVPEMHANIRLIAKEEVEVKALKAEIEQYRENLDLQKNRIAKLRQALSLQNASYNFAGRNYSRNQVKDDLCRRFELYKEAEIVLAGKTRLLSTRQQALNAAVQMLEKTKSQKQLLADKIEQLESKYRLIKAASIKSKNMTINNSQLAKTEKLIADINKRLMVAERVLEHEGQFQQEIPLENTNNIDENDLLSQIDNYFAPANKVQAQENNSTDSTEPLTVVNNN